MKEKENAYEEMQSQLHDTPNPNFLKTLWRYMEWEWGATWNGRVTQPAN
jgi:hypothetical protein